MRIEVHWVGVLFLRYESCHDIPATFLVELLGFKGPLAQASMDIWTERLLGEMIALSTLFKEYESSGCSLFVC